MPRGGVDGTVESTVGTWLQPAELLPELRYGLGSDVSPSQSGPLSTAGMPGPPALTRERTFELPPSGSWPAMYTLAGRVAGEYAGTLSPPVSGKNAIRPRVVYVAPEPI